MKSQLQMFYEQTRKIGGANQTFLELVADGMTREELARNIERGPVLWSRFANWMDKLPSAAQLQANQAALECAW